MEGLVGRLQLATLAMAGADLKVGAQGLGFRVCDLGVRVRSLGCGVQGPGFRIQGSGFRV